VIRHDLTISTCRCTLASVLVLSGYGLGLFLAAQVGPVTLLIVRSILRGGRAFAVGLAMAAAVVAIDLAYAIVGLAGVGSLLNDGSLRLWLGLASAAVLIGIGMRTLWIGWRARMGFAICPLNSIFWPANSCPVRHSSPCLFPPSFHRSGAPVRNFAIVATVRPYAPGDGGMRHRAHLSVSVVSA
jgi:hypothetical protein